MTIHKGFDFTQLGGMPLNQQRLEWMQQAYAELSGSLAALLGNNVIVSGCIVSGNTVSDGWIVVNGELLPFAGSQTGVLDTFLIRETRTPLTFKDGTQKSVQFSRFAQFGTSSDAIPWSDLTRLSRYLDISKHIALENNPHKVTKAQVGLGNLPNAKTDDISVSESDVLATSKMVTDAMANADNIIYSGRVLADKNIANINIKLPQKIDIDKCIVVANVYEVPYTDDPARMTSHHYKSGLYVSHQIVTDNTANTTTLRVYYNIDNMQPVDTYYVVYAIFKIAG